MKVFPFALFAAAIPLALPAADSPVPEPAQLAPKDISAAYVLVSKVTGEATLVTGDDSKPLRTDGRVPVKATVKTAAGASVAVTLSNGALMYFGESAEASLDVFTQEPFTSDRKVEELAMEPSSSRAIWHLGRGQLAAQLPRLRSARGSTFNVSTDAGLLWTQAGGASFMVVASATDIVITVGEGQMRFRPPGGEETVIKAGEQLRAEILGAEILKQPQP